VALGVLWSCCRRRVVASHGVGSSAAGSDVCSDCSDPSDRDVILQIHLDSDRDDDLCHGSDFGSGSVSDRGLAQEPMDLHPDKEDEIEFEQELFSSDDNAALPCQSNSLSQQRPQSDDEYDSEFDLRTCDIVEFSRCNPSAISTGRDDVMRVMSQMRVMDEEDQNSSPSVPSDPSFQFASVADYLNSVETSWHRSPTLSLVLQNRDRTRSLPVQGAERHPFDESDDDAECAAGPAPSQSSGGSVQPSSDSNDESDSDGNGDGRDDSIPVPGPGLSSDLRAYACIACSVIGRCPCCNRALRRRRYHKSRSR